MAVRINKHTSGATGIGKGDQYDILAAFHTDIAALRAAIVAITAKLDADGGVTDTNYAATCDPAAQSTSLD